MTAVSGGSKSGDYWRVELLGELENEFLPTKNVGSN